jgi:signal transduction histidine kinase
MVSVVLIPGLRLAEPTLVTVVVAETVVGCIAAVAAALAYGNYRDTGALSDLALTGAFTLFGLSVLFLFIAPLLWPASSWDGSVSLWAMMTGQLLAAGALLAAAWVPTRPRPRLVNGWLLLGGAMAVLLTVGGGVLLLDSWLPQVGQVGAEPAGTLRASPITGPLQTLIQLAGAGLFGAAGVGFWRRARSNGDVFTAWLSAASLLGASAWVHYLLYPSRHGVASFSGDVLRLGFFLLVAFAVGGELREHFRQLAVARAIQERHAIARDLHDGVAQELAFLSVTAASLARTSQDPTHEQLAAAARRALDETRRAVAELRQPVDQPLEVGLAAAVEDVAHRLQIGLVLDLQSGIRLPPRTEESLVRIASEAVNNAARHGAPTEIVVTLRGDGPLVLRVEDDGVGFDPAALADAAGGFGLSSMRQRAEATGGRFELRSRPGGGTSVEVRIP